MGECGARYKPAELLQVMSYTDRMLSDRRIIGIHSEGLLKGLVFFSICDDAGPFYKKGLWEYLPHVPEATIFYPEKLVARIWNRELRRNLETAILKEYPQIEGSIWYRSTQTNDRKVVYR